MRWLKFVLCELGLLVLFSIDGQDLPQVCGRERVRYGFDGLPHSTYRWEISGASILNNYNDSVDVLWDNTNGIHQIKVTEFNVLGCQSNPSFGFVMVKALPKSLSYNVYLCEGEKVKLEINTEYKTIQWNNGSNASFLETSTPGYYWADITFANGCSARDSSLVQIKSKPSFSFGNDISLCSGQMLTLDPGIIATSYHWSNGQKTPTISISEAGTYWAKLTNAEGCSSADTVIVKSCAGNFASQISNVFTPNNDQDNDTWRLDFLGDYTDAEVTIYNRWGQMVYHTKHFPMGGWDGNSNGSPLPVDVYYYIIRLDHASKPLIGSITIVK